jgi:hypothetical protein
MMNKLPAETLHKRSAQMYSDMKKRAAKGLWVIPFTLESFRAWLDAKFDADGSARCEYSGDMVLVENFTLDHKIPVSRGGEWGLSNLAVCTSAENLRKGMMSKQEYEDFRTYVNDYFPHEVASSIWRRLQVGDVQRFAHFRRQRKGKL